MRHPLFRPLPTVKPRASVRAMPDTADDRIIREIDQRRDALVALTQDLIRIPTLNPPGHNYLEICEYLADRLGRQGFFVELIRAEGAPGDSSGTEMRQNCWNLEAPSMSAA